ncbi:hypothetical protein RJ640_021716 [Escallonia rubra]|uniref:BHLH domain-containing protein n=1 Tax=Escallonia rubra TaxID=112253 RepID=A0AA88UAU6_9ASTE|nr:hypothetical protein RJ640_021716 [Escallonia rubra]
MGDSPLPVFLPNKGKCNSRKSTRIKSKRCTRMFIKRKARSESSRRPGSGIERKVRTLKKLVPNSGSTGLDGLFRETADYILSLEVRVKLMQVMVKYLPQRLKLQTL